MNPLSIVLGADRPDLIRQETLATLFAESAKLHPDKTALIFHDQSLTYAELDRWSNAVAHYLNKKGIARGSKVGVWWQRGLELHVAILGIVKSGATYVPVDREIPAERVELILDEVEADGIFSLQKLNSPCPRLLVPPMPSIADALKYPKARNLMMLRMCFIHQVVPVNQKESLSAKNKFAIWYGRSRWCLISGRQIKCTRVSRYRLICGVRRPG
jgi:acyl-coenzyme A synthetase/AMP-(fatty) acid ligase